MGLSLTHILVFAVVAVVLLGGGRISGAMGDLAKGLKSFKAEMTDDEPTRRLD